MTVGYRIQTLLETMDVYTHRDVCHAISMTTCTERSRGYSKLPTYS